MQKSRFYILPLCDFMRDMYISAIVACDSDQYHASQARNRVLQEYILLFTQIVLFLKLDIMTERINGINEIDFIFFQ